MSYHSISSGDKCLELFGKVERSKDYMINLACSLIKIPTINPPGLNYEEFVENAQTRLEELGLKTQVIKVPCDFPDRYILLGRTEKGKSLIHFHCHYDVVPSGDEWGFDPFTPIIRDGKIFGRGSSDMKGGIASVFLALKVLLELGIEENVSISLTPDEETGGQTGAKYLVENRLVKTEMAVMPEPSGIYNIWNSSKAALWLKVAVCGRQSHSALQSNILNAFEGMLKVALEFMNVKEEINKRDLGSIRGPEAILINLGGICSSGSAVNVVPGNATFTVDIRSMTEEGIEAVELEIQNRIRKLKEKDPKLKVYIKKLLKAHAFTVREEHPLCKLLEHCIKETMGMKPKFTTCPGFLDARFFNKAGIPCIAYGPGLLEASHSSNEFVIIEHLVTAAKVYALMVTHLANSKCRKKHVLHQIS